MSKTASQWLSRFRVDITSNSNRIYANGRQQVAVTVTLEPRDGQTITDQQLDSIALLEVDEQGEFRLLNNLLVEETQRDTRFESHAASGSNPQNLLQSTSTTRRRTFYVSSRHPGGTLSTVYAGIYMDEDNHYETNAAPFKSSVVIESVTPRRFSVEHFELVRNHLIENDAWDIDDYYLKFRDPNYRIVDTIAYGVPGTHPFDERSINNHTWYTFGTATSYDRYCIAYDIKSDEYHDLGIAPPVEINSKPGMMTLLRLERVIEGRFRASSEPATSWSGDSIWGIFDQHGNEHVVRFSSADDGNRIEFKMHP